METNRVPKVINVEEGSEQFGGDEEMFFMMIDRFEDLSLDPNLIDLHNGLFNRNWNEVYRYAHSIRAAAGFILEISNILAHIQPFAGSLGYVAAERLR